jgi:hypothetical protein
LHLVVATPTQIRALNRAVAPVYTQLEQDARTRAFLGEIETLKREVTAEPSLGCARVPVSAAQRGASPLDGAWEMEVSRDYLIRHHPSYLPPPDEEALRLDSGWYRFVFRNGRVSAWHRSPVGKSQSTGVFTISGDTIALRYTGGQEAGHPPERYRWSIYRGMLTFRPLDGAPANPGLAPWHRVPR